MPVCTQGVNGQVLDLETAVKDGVLGFGGGGVGFGGGFAEKIDLKKMIEELNLPEIPSVFICPISLDPMEDPVTLCTGQTYERSNILKWFNLGHFTCPTTMQELWDDSLTPNTTLQRLVHTWFSQKYLQMRKKSEDVSGTASEILDALKQRVKGRSRVSSLKELRRLVAAHAAARKAVVDGGGVGLLSSFLGPYTSHAIGSEVVSILVRLELDSVSRSNLAQQPAKMSLIVDMLNEGSIETKIDCVRLIGILMEGDDFEAETVSSHGLLVALMKMVRDKRVTNGNLAALRLLKSISAHTQVRVLIVSIGAIPQLVELLPELSPDCLELALSVLDNLSTVREGKLGLSNCSKTIPNMVRILMRVSENCTQHALSILWSVCELSPQEYSLIAVDVGLAAKLLLVIQSGCNPSIKQQSAELLKLCSLNYSDSIFISKCKLTRTIQ